MKFYIVTLILSTLLLFAYVKRSYRYASVQDEIDPPPIDFEDTKAYKENISWFKGIGRC